MTRLKENEESSLTGMVGEFVVAKRYGKKYLRSAPVRTKDSWTPVQLLHLQWLSNFSQFLMFSIFPLSRLLPVFSFL